MAVIAGAGNPVGGSNPTGTGSGLIIFQISLMRLAEKFLLQVIQAGLLLQC